MRPAPAIIAAPPLAIDVLADDVVEADIVRDNAAVAGGPFFPGSQVIEDPLLVCIVVAVHECMGNQAGGIEVEGHVATVHAGVHFGNDVGIDSVVGPGAAARRKVGVDDVLIRCQVVIEHHPVRHPVFGGRHKARSVTTGQW